MEYWKEVFAGHKIHFSVVSISKNMYIIISNWIEKDAPLPKSSKVKVGGTMYLVSSHFKRKAKGSVVDKVKRLIEREAENIAED